MPTFEEWDLRWIERAKTHTNKIFRAIFKESEEKVLHEYQLFT